MEEELNSLKERRSVRHYRPDPIPEDMVRKVADAGIYAASGMNRQSSIVIAVTNREIRDRLSRVNAEIMGTDSDPFYGAPAVLIVLADKAVPTHVYDGSLVMGSLMQAAHDLGLGSCWIHRAKEEFEMPEWREWLSSLGIKGDYEGIGHCILGYPEGEDPKPAPRRDGRVILVK